MNILCFGDSNTFGYDPRGYFGERYDTPWPQLLSERFGWSIQNQGQNGREIPQYQVDFPANTELLIIMLGTNDLLQGNSAKTVAKRMETFLENINLERSNILLFAPPSMKLGTWVSTERLIEQSRALGRAYQRLAERFGIRFVDTDSWNIPLAFDGVHFTEEGHRIFSTALANYLTKENK